jgi:hypothetical protein
MSSFKSSLGWFFDFINNLLFSGFIFLCGNQATSGSGFLNFYGLANPTKGFWTLFKTNSPYLDQNKLRSRQI